ncbi:hypothetical protein ABT234_20920 [Streptomyces sp. NPDC001586]|uniref:hypothetical protein n=1 Tax=Streptomyces sp. NPDC001586 TaxID=3154387 RepID=UPI0033315FBB
MTTPQENRRPDLYGAIGGALAEQQAAAAAKRAPDREQHEAGLDRDAALYGTAAWDALSPMRKARVARHVASKTGPEAA